MENSDCVVIDIESGIVCPMCSEHVCEKEMAKTCEKNIPDHNVCTTCRNRLEKYGYGGGCAYCGHRSEREENIIIASAPSPRIPTHSVLIRNSDSDLVFRWTVDGFCLTFCSLTLVIVCIALLYVFGNLLFNLGQIAGHWIDKKDHTHKMEMSLQRCVVGYLGWIIIAYILTQIVMVFDGCYEKACFPCWKRSGSCSSNIKKCCSWILLLPQPNTSDENSETAHQGNTVFVLE